MTLARLVAQRADLWDELDTLVREAGRRPERLGGERVRRMGRLYRAAAADLALVRTRWPADPLRTRLEALVTRARPVVYATARRRPGPWRFVTTGYYRDVAAARAPVGVAAGLLIAGVVLGWLWAAADPVAALATLPVQLQGGPAPHPGGAASIDAPLLSTAIFTNNIRVAFLCFAGGLSAGLVTAGLLLYNGLMLGVVAAVAGRAGQAAVFWSLILPHGLLELSCITIAGGAGLVLGRALIDPGPRTRATALVAAARPAVRIALGTALWLVVAGLIEGFVTPRRLPVGAALAVGVAAAATLWSLAIWRGRAAKRHRGTAAGVAKLSAAHG